MNSFFLLDLLLSIESNKVLSCTSEVAFLWIIFDWELLDGKMIDSIFCITFFSCCVFYVIRFWIVKENTPQQVILLEWKVWYCCNFWETWKELKSNFVMTIILFVTIKSISSFYLLCNELSFLFLPKHLKRLMKCKKISF